MADLMRNSKKKITVRKALYGPGAFLIACAALIFLMSIFFRVKTVEVRGNSYYTAEEVELASGVVEADYEDRVALLAVFRLSAAFSRACPMSRTCR